MVEVFKTNVKDSAEALMLMGVVHIFYPQYKSNFDLDDCDKIFRVQCSEGEIDSAQLIDLFASYGFDLEILSDTIVPVHHKVFAKPSIIPLN